MEIPLTGHTIPASLKSVRLEVEVAGRTETKAFAPKPDLTYEYVWDRRDAYGREVQGRQPVTIRIGFVYGLRRYDTPASFAAAFGKFSDSAATVIGELPQRGVQVRQLAHGARRVRPRARRARRPRHRPRRLGARRPPRL